MMMNQSFLPNLARLQPDIVMLVANDGWDIRALKQARSLAAQGYSVVMVGRRRYHTELARFCDECGIDIVNVPMIIGEETMRLHLESGVWMRMSFFERCLASLLLACFAITDLAIKPKVIPPPIHAGVVAQLVRRMRMLAKKAENRGRSRPVKSSGRNPWTLGLIAGAKKLYRGFSAQVFRILGAGPAGATTLRFCRYLGFALLSPVIGVGWAIGWLQRKGKVILLRALRSASATKSKSLAPLRWLAARWRGIGQQAFRYSRFFLYTIEYGETVARLNPRAIHAHDLYTLQAATRIAAWTGAKVVYDAHELESDRRASSDERMKRWIISQEKTYAPKATRCITVSHAIADEMERELSVRRPEVVFNAPVASRAPLGWEHRTLRSDLRLEPGVPLFVFVGKVYNLYNSNQKVGLIIEALGRCEGYHLAIVGPIASNAIAEVEALQQRLGMRDRLHLVPPIPAEAIINYIGDADAGIYFMAPDTRNIDLTIPNKLFEFSLAGLPLVVSDLTSTRWFCDQVGNAILVSEGEPEAVALACRRAYQETSKLRPGPEKLAEIRRRFSWEAQGAKVVNLYDEMFRSG